MSNQIQISARHLGEMALPDLCVRCLWIKLRLRNKLPFQIFPGIFSSIDSYNKKVVHGWFDRHKSPPPWLKPLGDLVGYKDPPHYSRFKVLDNTYNIILTGSPDGILVRRDASHLIVDYKTAKFTGTQDELYPMYEAQLNVYALLANQLGFGPVAALALIYMEPITDGGAATEDRNQRDDGFAMGLAANILDVPLRPGLVQPLLARTREIYELERGPTGRAGCKDCPLVEGLIGLFAR